MIRKLFFLGLLVILIINIQAVDFFKEDFEQGKAKEIPEDDEKGQEVSNLPSQDYDSSFDISLGEISGYEGGDLDFKDNGGSFIVLNRKVLGYNDSDFSIGENIKVETIKSQIVVERPVKWIKNIQINKSEIDLNKGLSIVISNEVKDIVIKTGRDGKKSLKELEKYEELIQESDRDKISSGKVTGFVSKDIKSDENFILDFFSLFSGFLKKGESLDENKLKEIGRLIEDEKAREIDLTEIAFDNDEIVVEYYTEAPKISEKEINYGKIVNVSSKHEMGYENILSYTELDSEVPKENIKIYNIEGERKNSVDFKAYDLNKNGLIDYVEWKVPHLSSQIYEIEIKKFLTFHLDKKREFVGGIYEDIKNPDKKYTELIKPGEYIRVTFESDLDSSNELVFIAKSEKNAFINVYEKDGDEIIGTFGLINEEKEYSAILNKLRGKSNTFDLRISPISESGVQFDYIANLFIIDEGILPTIDSNKNNYYDISTCSELQGMLFDLGRNYELVKDIDCKGYSYKSDEGKGFMPIGDSSESFRGHFNGNSYSIRNLFIDRDYLEEVGLFGSVSSDSIIKNIGLVDFKISGGNSVGALVVNNHGTIRDSYSLGEIVSLDAAGVFVYRDNGKISNCYSFIPLKKDVSGNLNFLGEGTLTGVNNLEFEKIDPLFFSSELSKTISIKVRNSANNFLNDCRFVPKNNFISWSSESNRKDIASGQIEEYKIKISIPDEIPSGDYNVELDFKCRELIKEISIPVQVIQKKFNFEIIEAEISENYLNLTYSLRELSGNKQNINLNLKIMDSNKVEIANLYEEISIDSEQFKEFNASVPIKNFFEGEIILYANLNSESYSLFEQENILLSKKLTISGFAIKNSFFNITNISLGLLILGILFFIGFKLLRRFRSKPLNPKEERRKELFKEYEDDDSNSGMNSFVR